MDNSQNLVLVAHSEPENIKIQISLSIIIPSYNHEIYINECLDSINTFNVCPIEVIIIDDASSDKTVDFCKKFAFNKKIHYKIYTKKKNKGLVDSLSEGLKLSTGKYVSLMASDDKYDLSGIESALTFIEKNSCDVLICQARHFGMLSTYVYDERIDNFFKKSALERLEAIWSYPPEPMLLQSCIFNADLLKKINPWSSYVRLDDWPLFINLFNYATIRRTSIILNKNINLAMYRIHPGGSHTNLLRQYELIKETYIKFVPSKYRDPGCTKIALNSLIRLGFSKNAKFALVIARKEKYFLNRISVALKILISKVARKFIF